MVMRYRADFDGLRGVAILPVVLHGHVWPFSGGFLGVDVFFVISGFSITGIIAGEIEQPFRGRQPLMARKGLLGALHVREIFVPALATMSGDG